MYKLILIPLENSASDKTILEHIKKLAKLTNANLLLVHVADGWVARNYEALSLRESEEMKQDQDYLDTVASSLEQAGFNVQKILAMGDPATQLIKIAKEQAVDLIAMSTHGHRLISDILYGSTADKVRHRVDIPVLLLKAQI